MGGMGRPTLHSARFRKIVLLRLIGNTSNDNDLAGYDIDTSAAVEAAGNKAKGNADNTVP